MQATKETITRDEAERRIEEWQQVLLQKHNSSSICDLEYNMGEGGPHCGGIHNRKDAELREHYRGEIENIAELSGCKLIKAIVSYHMQLLSDGEALTCKTMAAWSPVCTGLSRFSNQELLLLFDEVLGDCEIVR